MNIEWLRSPRVISFLKHLSCLPAAWVLGNYGDQWVAYIESGSILLFIVYATALLLLMAGLIAPIALLSKRWQMIIAIPAALVIMTLGMPYLNYLKEKAYNNPVVHKEMVSSERDGISL